MSVIYNSGPAETEYTRWRDEQRRIKASDTEFTALEASTLDGLVNMWSITPDEIWEVPNIASRRRIASKFERIGLVTGNPDGYRPAGAMADHLYVIAGSWH